MLTKYFYCFFSDKYNVCMNSQNRAGGKTNAQTKPTQAPSAGESYRYRRERLRQLALETIDPNKDPIRQHLLQTQCKRQQANPAAKETEKTPWMMQLEKHGIEPKKSPLQIDSPKKCSPIPYVSVPQRQHPCMFCMLTHQRSNYPYGNWTVQLEQNHETVFLPAGTDDNSTTATERTP
ncbi:uncharacterized protein LOC125767364 isoform X2 [Anopheles funestus]|uniref:uncharacterized protein LOC125767364 isoform X2 n=1 Tax=Anopheles funestus TaxID=62324 RepID=UPI0020C6DECF|nr:uncharacterized protein LOC125767364 isoform X2 [Anopheles funestus]